MRPWFDPDDDRYGPDDDPPPAPVGLTPAQCAELAAALEHALADGGCDGTLRIAESWARGVRVPWPSLRRALEANGGYCDCEIGANVFPE